MVMSVSDAARRQKGLRSVMRGASRAAAEIRRSSATFVRRLSPIAILALGAALGAPEHIGSAQPDALAIIDEFDRMAPAPLWPGFDPRTIPLAIYDGRKTSFLRHPHPPAGSAAVLGRKDVVSLDARHPAITANSSAEIEGVHTATLLLTLGTAGTSREIAAIAIHEAFHVFQAQRHPEWGGNEMDLFTYPVTDVELLGLRRLESECLRGALAAVSRRGAACWSVRALAYRDERFGRMNPESAAYERGTELKEGLAQYVQYMALGSSDRTIMAESEDKTVRQRAYAAGEAMALILDRLDPDWPSKLEKGPAVESLDRLIAQLVRGESAEPCYIDEATQAQIRARASADVGVVVRDRVESRSRFFSQRGWRIELRAATGEWFWPKGFDPMNVKIVGDGEVLHTRFLNVGNERAEVEIFDRASLTAGAGEHPLFAGVSGVTITGIPDEPKIAEASDATTIEGAGIKIRVQGAKLEKQDQVLTITIVATAPVQ